MSYCDGPITRVLRSDQGVTNRERACRWRRRWDSYDAPGGHLCRFRRPVAAGERVRSAKNRCRTRMAGRSSRAREKANRAPLWMGPALGISGLETFANGGQSAGNNSNVTAHAWCVDTLRRNNYACYSEVDGPARDPSGDRARQVEVTAEPVRDPFPPASVRASASDSRRSGLEDRRRCRWTRRQ